MKVKKEIKPRAKRARGLYLSDDLWGKLSKCDSFPKIGRSALAEIAIAHFLDLPTGNQYEVVGKYLQTKNPKKA